MEFGSKSDVTNVRNGGDRWLRWLRRSPAGGRITENGNASASEKENQVNILLLHRLSIYLSIFLSFIPPFAFPPSSSYSPSPSIVCVWKDGEKGERERERSIMAAGDPLLPGTSALCLTLFFFFFFVFFFFFFFLPRFLGVFLGCVRG